jgi:hypothetical protein
VPAEAKVYQAGVVLPGDMWLSLGKVYGNLREQGLHPCSISPKARFGLPPRFRHRACSLALGFPRFHPGGDHCFFQGLELCPYFTEKTLSFSLLPDDCSAPP